MVFGPEGPAALEEPDMFHCTCFANTATAVVLASARAHAGHPTPWQSASFGFEMITKPYARQRPSGTPPG